MSVPSDRRDAAAIGRSARLELVFGVRDGRTVLEHGYAEPPLRVGRPLPDGDGVHLILASSAPGIFASDEFVQQVVLGAGARVRLTSQSSLQVHPSTLGGQARLQSTYEIGADATLVCEWEPFIPFAGSRFDQRTEVRMDATARLVWHEAMMAGREGRGERWQFAALGQHLEVTRGDLLEYLERYELNPGEHRLNVPWVAGECCYFGTTLTVGVPATAQQAEELHLALTEHGSHGSPSGPGSPGGSGGAGGNGSPGRLHAAVDRLAASVMLARLAASHGAVFHKAREIVAATLRDLAGGPSRPTGTAPPARAV